MKKYAKRTLERRQERARSAKPAIDPGAKLSRSDGGNYLFLPLSCSPSLCADNSVGSQSPVLEDLLGTTCGAEEEQS